MPQVGITRNYFIDEMGRVPVCPPMKILTGVRKMRRPVTSARYRQSGDYGASYTDVESVCVTQNYGVAWEDVEAVCVYYGLSWGIVA